MILGTKALSRLKDKDTSKKLDFFWWNPWLFDLLTL
jgi:hypothetical protein